MKNTLLWSHLTALIIGAMLATGITLTLTSNDDSGVEIHDTFTATVQTYYGPDSDHKNTICFELEDDPCGQPILANDDMVVKVGQTVTATELGVATDPNGTRIVYYIHPLE